MRWTPSDSGRLRLRSLSLIALALCAFLHIAPTAGAQRTAGACDAGCTVVAREVVRLDASSDPDLEPLQWTTVLRLADGRFLAAPVAKEGRLAVFDRGGRLARGIGRLGGGPQEYMPITSLARAANAQVAVFERGSRRLTLLSPDGAIARRVAMPFAPQLGSVVRGEGRWIVASVSRVPERVGRHFHAVDDRGVVLRSFGEGGPVNNTRYNGAVPHQRAIGARRAGGVWSVVVHAGQGHLVEEWSASGALIRRIDLGDGWLPARTTSRVERIDATEAAVSIAEDGAGRVWVTSHQLKPDGRTGAGAERALPADLNRAYRSIVRVFDPAAGRLLGGLEIDGYVAGPSADFLWTQVKESAAGEPVTQVYTMVLQPTAQGARR